MLADDCLLTDRSGLPRSRPLLRLVLDSQLRLPIESRMVRSAGGDLTVVTTSAAADDRRRALESAGVEVIVLDGPGGRTDFPPRTLARRTEVSCPHDRGGEQSELVRARIRVVDKIFFYYAPKILGGTLSLPVAGGAGRGGASDAIRFHNLKLHQIPPDEFAVEAWLEK